MLLLIQLFVAFRQIIHEHIYFPNPVIQQCLKYYSQHLSHIDELQLPKLPSSTDDKYAFHTYIIKAKNRDTLQQYLLENNIETRLHYNTPIYKHEIGQRTLGYTPDDFPKMNYIADHCLSLPIYPELTQDELKYITSSIEAFYKTQKQSRSQTCTSHIPI